MPYTSAQLQAIYTKIHVGLTPSAATIATLDTLAAQNASATLTDAQTYQAVLDTADADTAVAITAYQYFTAKTPTQAGLAYLVNSTANSTDLNDLYYAQFNQANRYINFAQNLGLQGEGAAFFQAAYGGMTFAQVVTTAYDIIIGNDRAQAAGFNPTAAVADIVGRQSYFAAVAAERFQGMNQDLAVKAAVIGYIMSEAVKANVGNYSNATSNFLAAIDAGTATYNTSLTTTYSTAPGIGGGTGGGGSGSGGGTPNAGFPTTAPAPATSVSVDLSAAAYTEANVVANAGYVVTNSNGVNALTLTLANSAGASDVLNLAIAPTGATGINVAKIAVAGVETLNVTSGGSLSGGGATNALTLDAATNTFATVAIFGAQPLSLTTGAYTRSVFLNGGGATGELVLNASGMTGPTVNSTIAGGLRNDTISPATGATGSIQSIYGGGGGDLFNLGVGHTVSNALTYKAAAESRYDVTGTAGASGTSTPNTGTMDVVNNFISGRDKIDVSFFAFTTAQAQVVSRAAADTTALATLAGTATFFQDGFGTTRSFAAVNVGADIYLYIDTSKNGFFEASNDLTIKLVGLASFASGDIVR